MKGNMKMLKHMRILAVALLAAMLFAGCGESSSSSSSSSGSSSDDRNRDFKKLAEGKKAIEEDKKRGIRFEEGANRIELIQFPKDSNIKNYKIPYGVAEIWTGAFKGCTNLTSVTIPNSVTVIGAGAFNGCINLTSVTIPNSVTEIRIDAFWNCTNLTSITLPARFKGQEKSLAIPENCKVTYR